MSKINAVRLVNVNYNNNAIRISDECFHFNGESTLLSLRNGGGKSVLVQMMTAPFVHKKWRNTKDRPFESYFTTNKPSFILVEWALDQGAGYVLTGMMVRRSQNVEENGQEDELEIVQLISEYTEPCLWDIHNLPIVEKSKKEVRLKTFAVCRQLFEDFKRERKGKFFCYDMGNTSQSRQYFEKLLEYQINHKEWETIIKKVNMKESGLSELFADCKDEKGLVEKWLLEAVADKLDKDKNRVKEFQSILEKYAGQYKDNQSKIKRREVIRSFKEESVEIRERAESYQAAEVKEQTQKNRAVCFYQKLEELHDETEKKYQDKLQQKSAAQIQLARVEYEDLSNQVHERKKDERYHASNRDMIEFEREHVEQEAEQLERQLHILHCAKQQEAADENKDEWERILQKLKVLQEEEEELEPERNRLGGCLYAYYSKERDVKIRVIEEQEERRQTTRVEAERLLKEQEELEQKICEQVGLEGKLKGKLEGYDSIEEQFRRRYEAELDRNILGEYEPGLLEILKKTYEQQMEEQSRGKIRRLKEKNRLEEEIKRLERDAADHRSEQQGKKSEWERCEEIQSSYEKELEERRVVLKYLDLDEAVLFDKAKIIAVSNRKKEEIAGRKRSLEREEEELRKEYQRLIQGKILEMPEELEKEIAGLGIQPVYGMEWLQKNGYTEEQNVELIRQQPFLPYALIMSKRDVERLRNNGGTSYTSFPIPIVLREELAEKKKITEGNVISLAGVSFYVLFNENLLNEEKLRLLVQEKEQQIMKKREVIEIRSKEYEEYFKRQELVENQKVTKELYEKNTALLQELKEQIENLGQMVKKEQEEQRKLNDGLKELEAEIEQAKERIQFMQRRQEDFEQLRRAYETYLEQAGELERCRRQIGKIRDRQGLIKNRLGQLEALLESLRLELERLKLLKEQVQEKWISYEKYAELSVRDIPEKAEARQMEHRYEAITGEMSASLRELEEQEKREAVRYQKEVEELERLCKKYHFSGTEWRQVSYNGKEELHLESRLEDCRREINKKQQLWNEENTKLAVIRQQIADRLERIRKECGQEQVLEEREIHGTNFAERKNQLRFQEQQLAAAAQKLDKKVHSYSENLTALAEYSQFAVTEQVDWKDEFDEMSEKELRNFKGSLIRDYKTASEEKGMARERLIQLLNQIVRRDLFQDAFYKKPLESMLELAGDAKLVLKQLDTTLQSYDSLMEKLNVDISVIEKEKDKIVELLEEYVREVHRNLGMIDRNSTITIREKPVKMLKIQLPEWEEQENIYHLRIENMVDEVTLKGVELFEKNENAHEHFGAKITTKNLYDTVVGIGNVQIRLYKIEEQREYPITWAEVAKNSGGEGFLSAFVILSSLLYYMRKDETDIFADRNEGKVLLMDNPFAQTNAAHLLKPLMDMAKKTNTQLICLTGLGGESIYSRFNNIYVMNLVAASLRNGLQYLKVDHVRGNEPEMMLLSHIEVMEQQELIF